MRVLLSALREERGQPKVPELSSLLMQYFEGTCRQKRETMSDYVTRKAEAYTRAPAVNGEIPVAGGSWHECGLSIIVRELFQEDWGPEHLLAYRFLEVYARSQEPPGHVGE